MSDVFTDVLMIPLYPTGSCPHIDESFNCHLNDLPDKAYVRLQWQPSGCRIPRWEKFTATTTRFSYWRVTKAVLHCYFFYSFVICVAYVRLNQTGMLERLIRDWFCSWFAEGGFEKLNYLSNLWDACLHVSTAPLTLPLRSTNQSTLMSCCTTASSSRNNTLLSFRKISWR